MADRPILFSAPMVRALLDGRKTQTRRIVNGVPPQPAPNCHPSNTPRHPAPYLDSYCGQPKTPANPRGMSTEWMWWQVDDRCGYPSFKVKFAPGDRLWVRETWRPIHCLDPWHLEVLYNADGEHRHFADGDFGERDWTMPKAAKVGNVSPLFMPRWASRLTLTVTDVRVQQLHAISEQDARDEGAERLAVDDDGKFYESERGSHVCGFTGIWSHINGADSWDANPWVAAYTFSVDRRNIDGAVD